MSPSPPNEPAADAALTPPCLFYLFADRVLPREGHWNHAMGDNAVPVPKTNTLVSLGALEQLLLTVGLWSLSRAGRIELVPSNGRGRYAVARAGGEGDGVGLEGSLVSGIPDEGRIDLFDLVMLVWVQDTTMPLNAIVVDAQREAMDAQVIARPDLPHLIPGFLGHHTFPRVEVNGPNLYRQRRAFARVSGDWAQDRAANRQWDDLVRRANRILYAARPTFQGLGALPLPSGGS